MCLSHSLTLSWVWGQNKSLRKEVYNWWHKFSWNTEQHTPSAPKGPSYNGGSLKGVQAAKACPPHAGPQEGSKVLRDTAGPGRPADGPALHSADTGDLKLVSSSPWLSFYFRPSGGKRSPSCLPTGRWDQWKRFVNNVTYTECVGNLVSILQDGATKHRERSTGLPKVTKRVRNPSDHGGRGCEKRKESMPPS